MLYFFAENPPLAWMLQSPTMSVTPQQPSAFAPGGGGGKPTIWPLILPGEATLMLALLLNQQFAFEYVKNMQPFACHSGLMH
jgi:hypothetical protein